MLAGQLHHGGGLVEPQRFDGVHHAEVDQLGDVGVGLEVVLADFKHQPGFQLELALAQKLRNSEQQRGALLHRGRSPGLERLERRLHGGLDFGGPGLLVDAHHLRRLGRIDRRRRVAGLDAASADDQVVLAAQFAAHLLDGGLHLAQVLGVGPVDHGLVDELVRSGGGNAVFGGGMGQG